jgi:hypothetical protein
MSEYPNRGTEAQEGLLESIEQAIHERAQTGRASVVRHGLVAQVANATPPMNEALRRTLWARIVAEGTEKGRPERTSHNRAQPVKAGRFALVTLTAILLVALALTLTRTQIIEWNSVLFGRSGAGERPSAEDFDALAEAINGSPAPRTVVTYSKRASPIAGRVRYETEPLSLGEDATPAAIQGAIDTILPPHGYVDLVMPAVQESDTARHVRAAMERALYHLYQPSGQVATEVYGALERNTYLVGPEDVVLGPIGARFEGGIELVAGSVLDEPQAGMHLRVAFNWRVQEPVSESPVVFVHLMRGDYEVVAQRDAVPGNGLFPVEEWRPGELVRDQFALLLPPDLAAGEYEMRVGMYDATTQMRYSLTEPGEGTYVVVQKWVLAGPVQGDQS